VIVKEKREKIIKIIEDIGIYLFCVLFISALLVGCGDLLKDEDDTDSAPQYRTENKNFNIKLISGSISDVRDSSTYEQSNYQVSTANRLLIRFPHILSHVSSMLVGDVGPRDEVVLVRVTISPNENIESAENSLNLCPMIRDWTMFSTWNVIEPFMGKRWNTSGGDFDASGCMSADPDQTENDQTLVFDMSQWVIDWPMGRNVNFGLILISDNPVNVRGDLSGSYSPRIEWKEQI